MSAGLSVGIMQPYFFPYLGHFALIAATDRWIVFDITQYTPKSWMSRNRILHPGKSWQYINVPLDGASMSIKTCESKVLDRRIACDRILRQLAHYRKYAPHYLIVTNLVESAFRDAYDDSLVALNVSSLKQICKYLEISFNYRTCSSLDLDIHSEMRPGDWAPTIASQIGVVKYVNPIGGKALFNPAQFDIMGIALGFLEFDAFEYITPGYTFEPNLSIIDVMMWNDAKTIREIIDKNSSISWAN